MHGDMVIGLDEINDISIKDYVSNQSPRIVTCLIKTKQQAAEARYLPTHIWK